MPDETAYRRDAPISYRPPKALREEFYRRAEESGLSMNAFITKCVFGSRAPRGEAERMLLARLLQVAGRIADRLEERRAAEPEPALEAASADLAEIRAALLTLMGRRP